MENITAIGNIIKNYYQYFGLAENSKLIRDQLLKEYSNKSLGSLWNSMLELYILINKSHTVSLNFVLEMRVIYETISKKSIKELVDFWCDLRKEASQTEKRYKVLQKNTISFFKTTNHLEDNLATHEAFNIEKLVVAKKMHERLAFQRLFFEELFIFSP
ncbi:MAG: hypothetical protein QXP53_00400 [Candidatus Pacearchaeota archaeon]